MNITHNNFTQYLFDYSIENNSCLICNDPLIYSRGPINRYYCPKGDLDIFINDKIIEIYSPTNMDIDASFNQIVYYGNNCDSRQYFPIESLNPLTFDNLLFQINKINVFE